MSSDCLNVADIDTDFGHLPGRRIAPSMGYQSVIPSGAPSSATKAASEGLGATPAHAMGTASGASSSHIRYVRKVHCSIPHYGASCMALGMAQTTVFTLYNRLPLSDIWMNDRLRALFLRLFAKTRETRLDRAENRLTDAAERFRLAAEASSGSQARVLWRLAGVTTDLRAQLRADTKAVDELKRLVLIHIPEMALIADKWAARAQKDPLASPDKAMREDFEHYLRVIEEAVDVCVSGRYDDLRRSNAILDQIMQRHRT